MASSTDTCSLCVDQSNGEAGEQTWLQCDACSAWYHAHCLKIPVAEVNDFETYHCSACVAGHGPSTLKPARRKSQRESIRLNYADMNEGLSGDEKIWGKLLKTKTFAPDRFTRYKGDQISLSRFRKSGMTEPFVIEDPAGLDMTMPPGDTSISAIADFVGEDRPVEVIDVATQASSPGWTMKKWANYVETPPDKRDRIRNVISLEISSTDFGKKMVRPRLVRDMDWIDQVWPAELKPKEYPKVQLYCLMGTQDSYTDFHIDFGGTSVFYHILRGSKVFYFIEPTSKNLKKYQKWSSSPDQSAVFLGDLVKTCYAVHLHAGNTMIIPTGWIHAVYTPEDALVIGGNFLHGLNIGTQLKIYDIEEITKVPDKFRFPFFKRINWYAVEKYVQLLNDAPQDVSVCELQGLLELASWLRSELASDAVHDIPMSIKDPKALLRRLITAVENATLARASPHQPPGSPLIKLKLKAPQDKPAPEASPKLTLTLKQSPQILPKNDMGDAYLYDSFADDDDFVQDDVDSDDVDYQESLPSLATSAPTKKRRRRLAKSSDSSSDDDMGTSFKAKKSTSSSIFGTRQQQKRMKSSAKQRLMDRMTKRS